MVGSLTHPDNLDPCSGSCVQQYSYNTTTGTLDGLAHPSASGGTLTTSFTRDNQGRVTSVGHPGGVSSDQTYDHGGRVDTRSGPLTNDALSYDATGRLISGSVYVANPGVTVGLTMGYSALGSLQYSSGGTYGATYEEFKTDAIGNRLWTRDDGIVNGVDRAKYLVVDDATGQLQSIGLGTGVCGAPGTGLGSCHPSWYYYEFNQDHDAAGNVTATWSMDTQGSGTGAQWTPEETRSYYSADDKLMYYERHVGWADPGDEPGVFEEYRYDALGRRVLVRSRRPSTCSSPCDAYIQRTIWDGDQMLYETRSSGGTGVSSWALDYDGSYNYASSPDLFGTVVYAQLPGSEGLDAPVGVLKHYSTGGWDYLTPYANYRGEYTYGTTATGGTCTSVGSGCPNWPGFARSMDGWVMGTGTPTYVVWWGSVIRGAAENSGIQYLRNRYYDSRTGRFTQEDTVGLAGGLNLYGLAEGDPVNFSDPFGLCPGYAGGDGKTKGSDNCSTDILNALASKHIIVGNTNWHDVDATLRDAVIRGSSDLNHDVYISARTAASTPLAWRSTSVA